MFSQLHPPKVRELIAELIFSRILLFFNLISEGEERENFSSSEEVRHAKPFQF
ncbi:hypothetical protein QUC31_010264 [Theobroma cacao]